MTVFAPVLRYLVEIEPKSGMYVSPKRIGITSGHEAWADDDLQFQNLHDAREFIRMVKTKYPRASAVKLRLRATRESIIQSIK